MSAPDTTEVREKAFRSILAVAVRGVLVRLVGFVGTIVLARYLAPREFGVIAFGLTILSIGRFLSDVGIGASLIRRPEPPRPDELRTVLGFQILVTTLLALAIAALAFPFGEQAKVAAVMAFSLVIESARTPASIVAERELNFKPLVLAEMGDTIAFYGVASLAVVAGVGVTGVAAASLVRGVVTAAIVLIGTRTPLQSPLLGLGKLRELLGFGVQYQANQLLGLGRDQGVNILTAAIGGAAALGVWNLTYRLLGAVYLLFQAVWRVSFSAMARLVQAGEDVAGLLQRSLQRMTLVTGCALVAGVGSGPCLVPWLFGHKWHEVLTVMPWVGIGYLIIGPISTCAAGYFYAMNQPGVMTRGLVVDVVLTIVLAVPALPFIGVRAVGIALMVAFAAQAALLASALRRQVGIKLGRSYLLPCGLAVIAGGATWAFAASRPAGFGTEVLSCSVGLALMVALTLLFDRRAVTDLLRLARRVFPGSPSPRVSSARL
jgi:O-antigen/teichoic acid export membrane protein